MICKKTRKLLSLILVPLALNAVFLLPSREFVIKGVSGQSPKPSVVSNRKPQIGAVLSDSGAFKAFPEPSKVKEYVISEAKKKGVNPQKADWIVSHESQYCQNVVGDQGKSLGCWQFNIQHNPGLSLECIKDLPCSTSLALNWIANGKESAWSSLRFCKLWYSDCPF